jgi:hypothetical protein
MSIWTDVFKNKEKLKNIFYDKSTNEKFEISCLGMNQLRLWEEYYMKYNLHYLNKTASNGDEIEPRTMY